MRASDLQQDLRDMSVAFHGLRVFCLHQWDLAVIVGCTTVPMSGQTSPSRRSAAFALRCRSSGHRSDPVIEMRLAIRVRSGIDNSLPPPAERWPMRPSGAIIPRPAARCAPPTCRGSRRCRFRLSPPFPIGQSGVVIVGPEEASVYGTFVLGLPAERQFRRSGRAKADIALNNPTPALGPEAVAPAAIESEGASVRGRVPDRSDGQANTGRLEASGRRPAQLVVRSPPASGTLLRRVALLLLSGHPIGRPSGYPECRTVTTRPISCQLSPGSRAQSAPAHPRRSVGQGAHRRRFAVLSSELAST